MDTMSTFSGQAEVAQGHISPRRHTDGGNVRGVEVVFSETDNQTRFSHSAVPDEQQLVKEIILFRHNSSESSNVTVKKKTNKQKIHSLSVVSVTDESFPPPSCHRWIPIPLSASGWTALVKEVYSIQSWPK